MSLTFPTPEPVNIPALPGCGSWRSAILDSVQAMLERTYDVSGDDLAGQLTEVAGKTG